MNLTKRKNPCYFLDVYETILDALISVHVNAELKKTVISVSRICGEAKKENE